MSSREEAGDRTRAEFFRAHLRDFFRSRADNRGEHTMIVVHQPRRAVAHVRDDCFYRIAIKKHARDVGPDALDALDLRCAATSKLDEEMAFLSRTPLRQ